MLLCYTGRKSCHVVVVVRVTAVDSRALRNRTHLLIQYRLTTFILHNCNDFRCEVERGGGGERAGEAERETRERSMEEKTGELQ